MRVFVRSQSSSSFSETDYSDSHSDRGEPPTPTFLASRSPVSVQPSFTALTYSTSFLHSHSLC